MFFWLFLSFCVCLFMSMFLSVFFLFVSSMWNSPYCSLFRNISLTQNAGGLRVLAICCRRRRLRRRICDVYLLRRPWLLLFVTLLVKLVCIWLKEGAKERRERVWKYISSQRPGFQKWEESVHVDLLSGHDHLLSGHVLSRHKFLDTKIIFGVVESVSNAKVARMNPKWKCFTPKISRAVNFLPDGPRATRMNEPALDT